MAAKKLLVKDLNPYLTCTLCGGYFIDATALVDCLHVFCRGCILRYFENCKPCCPTCNTIYKKKNATFFKPDTQLQTLVYKLVPGLYSKEMQRREDFYRTTGDRAGSSCSDDSVLGDLAQDHEEWISSYVGDKNQFYGPEDSISLSLEYYQARLDKTDVNSISAKKVNCDGKVISGESDGDGDVKKDDDEHLLKNDRRYLQCPAAVTMSHLQKFIRMKFGLTYEHKVDIIYAGEVLPQNFTLMDVAYTFKWNRTKPMRFFYRIFVFTPVKVVRPIKIITTSSSNGKQLQIVPVKTDVNNAKPEIGAAKPQTVPVTALPQPNNKPQESEENFRNKEKLLANLQLLSKNRLEEQQQRKKTKEHEESCVYEYEEPDKEEIKRFAEKRDREWALQKHLDAQQHQEETRHVSKKRKKNKHSKNESVHKKRKLHAEITSNEVLTKEESLKLKVKLTPHNGHKHKHHKQAVIEPPKPAQEQSSKEKLLQMRAVRHKHVNSNDEKSVQTVAETAIEVQTKKETPPPPPLPPPQSDAVLSPAKTLRSDFAIKTTASKELATAHAQNEQAQKVAFLKTFQSHPEKPNNNNNNNINKSEKSVPPVKIETKKPQQQIINSKLQQQNKSLERKIANLKQQCTIEPKNEKKNDGTKLLLIGEKNQYNTDFTVSKIEAGGVKRKAESEEKRPSLEITLINPPKRDEPKPKRPPPATIPLERIKKSMNFKSGISIIPKLPGERCDNIGALDLSKPSSATTTTTTNKNETKLNGITVIPTTTKNNCVIKKPNEKNAVHMANLQMLSKVALEHPTLNNKPAAVVSKTKQPLPNLQKMPTQMQQKSLPKLNEINKSQFRLINPRNMRPNQSQSVRNIPNPSLLVRQQNQNRLNSISQNGNNVIVKEQQQQQPSQTKTITTTTTNTAINATTVVNNSVAAITTQSKLNTATTITTTTAETKTNTTKTETPTNNGKQ